MTTTYDYEPDTVADALNWLNQQKELVVAAKKLEKEAAKCTKQKKKLKK